MVLLAFSLQDQIDKYGTYIGIAAFFGLAVLTLLYFAQAREVKRLREWAGRAPERAAELEMAVAEHAEEVRRVPATPVPAPQPVPVPVPAQQLPQTVPATNGVVKLKPAEVAALAFARSAGVHEPHEPKAHPEPVAAAIAAPPAEATTAAPAVGAGAPGAAKALNGDGAHPPVPKPATPAARRVEQPPPPPLPPRRVAAAAAAGRRSTSAPPPRESGARAVVITAVIGVLVLAGAIFGITRLTGGGEDPAPQKNVVATPTPENAAGGDDPAATATAQPSVTKDNAQIGVLNATGAPNLAANNAGLLTTEGYPEANIATGNLDQRQASVVLYARGARSAAADVADVLGISSVKQLVDDPQAQARAEQAEAEWDVVAVVGADKN